MEILAIILAIAASIFAGRFLFRFFFDDQEDFNECLRFYLTPDLFSLFKGQLFEDWARSTKFGFYLLVTFLPGLLPTSYSPVISAIETNRHAPFAPTKTFPFTA